VTFEDKVNGSKFGEAKGSANRAKYILSSLIRGGYRPATKETLSERSGERMQGFETKNSNLLAYKARGLFFNTNSHKFAVNYSEIMETIYNLTLNQYVEKNRKKHQSKRWALRDLMSVRM
jgi:hypothetical protein